MAKEIATKTKLDTRIAADIAAAMPVANQPAAAKAVAAQVAKKAIVIDTEEVQAAVEQAVEGSADVIVAQAAAGSASGAAAGGAAAGMSTTALVVAGVAVAAAASGGSSSSSPTPVTAAPTSAPTPAPTVAPQTLSLTKDDETITTAAGKNTIITAEAGTLNDGDIIIDGSTADADVLNVTFTSEIADGVGAPVIQGIESINVNLNVANGDDSGNSDSFDATNVTDATITINSTRATFDGQVSVTGLGANKLVAGSAVTDLVVDGITSGTVNAGQAETVSVEGVADETDEVSVTINGDIEISTSTDVPILNLVTTAAAEVTLDLDNGTTTVTVAGAGNVTIADAQSLGGLELLNGLTTGTLTADLTDDADVVNWDIDTLNVSDDAEISNAGANAVNIIEDDLTVVVSGASTDKTALVVNISGDQTSLTIDTSKSNTLNISAAATISTLNLGDETTSIVMSGDVELTDIEAGKSITVSGSGDLTVTETSNATKLVASALDGVLDYTGGTAVDTVTGTTGNDSIDGAADADVISGGDGDDTITGGAGADKLTGGAGADTFVYEDDGDFVAANATVDTIISGGDGTDTISFTEAGAVSIAGTDVWGEDITSVERIVANKNVTEADIALDSTAEDAGITTVDISAADALNASSNSVDLSEFSVDTTIIGSLKGKNDLTGGDGNDSITGGAAADTISGGDGDDIISSGKGGDTIDGGDGDDTITVGAGTNSITGGDGDDTINLSTSAGADTIIISATNGSDVVNDFRVGSGTLDILNIADFLDNNAAAILNLDGGGEIDLASAATLADDANGITLADGDAYVAISDVTNVSQLIAALTTGGDLDALDLDDVADDLNVFILGNTSAGDGKLYVFGFTGDGVQGLTADQFELLATINLDGGDILDLDSNEIVTA